MNENLEARLPTLRGNAIEVLKTSKPTLRGITVMLYRVFFGVLFLLATFQSYGASFPCHKANTWIEKTICSNKQLSHLDELLATTYKNALRNAFNKNALRADQRSWLKMIALSVMKILAV